MSVDPSCYNTIVNVRNIHEDMTNEQLKDIFSMYGTVTSCKIMVSGNVESGRFAYVAFQDPDAAEDAIIELNCQNLAGRRIYLRRSGEKIKKSKPQLKEKPKIANVETVNRCEIFVNRLNPIVTAEDLRATFRHCGTITSAKIIMEDRRSKGFGFVSFATQEETNKAVTEMNGHIMCGERIYVALATGTSHNKYSRGDDFARRWNDRRDVGLNLTASTPRPRRLEAGFDRALEDILNSLDDVYR